MYALELSAVYRQSFKWVLNTLWSLSWDYSLVCILYYCLFAETKSLFRQQHKLLGVLQTVESDTTHLSQVAIPAEKPVPDPEVRASTHGDSPVHYHCPES